MKKNKHWYQKCWGKLISTIIICLIISTPFIIDYAYLKGTPNNEANTAFSASDLIGLYGTVLGAIITGIGIYIAYRGVVYSVNKNHEQYLNEQRNSVRPIIVFNSLLTKFGIINLISLTHEALESKNNHISDSNEEKYLEFILNEIVFMFNSDGTVEIAPYLTKERKELIMNPVIPEVNKSIPGVQSASIKANTAFCCSFVFLNAGLGVATNLRLSLFKQDKCIVNTIPFNLCKDDSVVVRFFAEHIKFATGEYEIHINYEDIFGNEYTQKQQLSISDNSYSFDTSSNQTLLEFKEAAANDRT